MTIEHMCRSKISYALLRLVVRLMDAEKEIRRYATNEELYEAEIHMIKAIRENKGIHVTGLAQFLGVTKGAVSQIVSRLKKKGMIVRETDPENRSRVILRLTDTGEVAYAEHEQIHSDFDALIDGILAGTTQERRDFLLNFLNMVSDSVDEFKSRGLR